MEIDILATIKTCPLFAVAHDTALAHLAPHFKQVHLHKNQHLLRQGELSDDFYLLASGSMVVTAKTEDKKEKIIGKIAMNETVGELSALSREPRSATVKALESCLLLKLPSKIFQEFCHQHPAVIVALINMFNHRSSNMFKILSMEEPLTKYITIIPANKKVSLEKFAGILTTLINNIPDTILLSDYDPTLYQTHADEDKLEHFVKILERKHHTIIFLLKSYSTPLSKVCSQYPSKVFVVAHRHSRVYFSPFVPKKISNALLLNKTKAELVLLHDDDSKLPERTSRWLKFENIGLCHHIRTNREGDWQRLLRFITGRAIGVVLGGGGVRSWAHIGALKALQEMDIPIDILVGTSAGALAAGYYAGYGIKTDAHPELRKLSAITRKTVAFKNISWPTVSIFNGKDYTEQLKRMFGKTRIENLWLPAVCVSCNLSRNKQITSRTGYVWKNIRSSTAVPAIFPPVVINGEIHLDGGIINNLPVDVMKKFIGHRGTVIAIELTRTVNDTVQYNFPPILPFWKTLLAKLKLGSTHYHFPHFVDTFLKSLLAGSSVKQKENSQVADVLISPDLSKYSLLQINQTQEDELMKLGYDATVEAIAKWREMVA